MDPHQPIPPFELIFCLLLGLIVLIKTLKGFVPLGRSSRVIVILLNFQPMTGYYENSRKKECRPENLLICRYDSVYYILKVSAQMNASLPR